MRRFAWAPLTVVSDKRLKDHHVRVLLALSSFASMKTGQAFPSHNQIANRCARKRHSVIAALNHLQQLGYVSWSSRLSRNGRRTSNLYQIHWNPLGSTDPVDTVPTSDVDTQSTPILEQTISNKNPYTGSREVEHLSKDWRPNDESRLLGQDLGLQREALADLIILFVDYWTTGDQAVAARRSDWDAQFRTFIREQAARTAPWIQTRQAFNDKKRLGDEAKA